MTIFLTHIIFFIVSLILGGLFCIGLWISSQGEDEVAPNGELVNKGAMILYPFRRFLNKKKNVFYDYEGDQLLEFIENLKYEYRFQAELLQDMTITKNGFKVSNKDNAELWKIGFQELYKNQGIIYSYIGNEFTFSKCYEMPYYSQYITKPLLLCYKCYASIWGSLIYWTMANFATNINAINKDYSVLIPMWILYCFSLVSVNSFLGQKIK